MEAKQKEYYLLLKIHNIWKYITGLLPDKKRALLQDWVLMINLRDQANLTSALRGNDARNGTCRTSKEITRMIRFLVVRQFTNKSKYMNDKLMSHGKVIKFISEIYLENKHWVTHIILAGKVIGNHHPNNYTRQYWGSLSTILHHTVKKIDEKEKRINKIYNKYIDIYTKRAI